MGNIVIFSLLDIMVCNLIITPFLPKHYILKLYNLKIE